MDFDLLPRAPCRSCRAELDVGWTPNLPRRRDRTGDFIREQYSLPFHVRPREDCKGCVLCGADRNERSCSCEQASVPEKENPFAVLRKIINRKGVASEMANQNTDTQRPQGQEAHPQHSRRPTSRPARSAGSEEAASRLHVCGTTTERDRNRPADLTAANTKAKRAPRPAVDFAFVLSEHARVIKIAVDAWRRLRAHAIVAGPCRPRGVRRRRHPCRDTETSSRS